jgi:hypothetical protein
MIKIAGSTQFWGNRFIAQVIVGGSGFLPCDAPSLTGISLYSFRTLELKIHHYSRHVGEASAGLYTWVEGLCRRLWPRSDL